MLIKNIKTQIINKIKIKNKKKHLKLKNNQKKNGKSKIKFR